MKDEDAIILCMRKEDLEIPAPTSIVGECYHCGCEVWVTPSVVAHAKSLGAPEVHPVCSICITLYNQDELEMQPPSQETIDEILRNIKPRQNSQEGEPDGDNED